MGISHPIPNVGLERESQSQNPHKMGIPIPKSLGLSRPNGQSSRKGTVRNTGKYPYTRYEYHARHHSDLEDVYLSIYFYNREAKT